jgi:hypothetical protein
MMKITINGSNYEAEAGERLVDVINRVRKELIMSCSRARFNAGPHRQRKDRIFSSKLAKETSLGMNNKKKPAMGRIILRHRQKLQICSAWFLALWLNLGYLQSSRAGIDAGEFAGNRDLQSTVGEYFNDWFKRVDETQAVQPHWIAPLVTTTPLLTELYRYDQNW